MITQKESFKYLRLTICVQGGLEAEINARIQSANKLYCALNRPFIKKKEVSRETKAKIFNSVFIPIF